MNFIILLEWISLFFTFFTIILIWFTKFNLQDFQEGDFLRKYLLAIFSITSMALSTSFLLRGFFNIIKSFVGDISYLNNYLYLAGAITFLTLFCGYFYIKNYSDKKNLLKNFLVILSISLFNIFVGISSLKSILQIN